MASIKLGSSTTSAWPGKAPARIVPQLLDAMLGGGEMVAVEDLDAITGQQRWQGAAGCRDDRLQCCAVVRTSAAERFGSTLSSLL